MSNDSRLIIALDVYDIERAIEIAEVAEGKVRALKVNWPLVMTQSIGVVSKLAKYADVMCDFKVADIPNTNRLITEKAQEMGAWAIISHTFTGSQSLKAVKDAAGDMKVFGVVAMSHPGADEFMMGMRHRMLEMAIEAGIYGIIAPGNNYDITREIRARAGTLKIASPGVGAQGGNASEAVRSGSDFVIVGRTIYEAENPSAAIDSINEEVKRVVELK